jgi:hypothetical protein
MDEMTSKERILAALACQDVDRVPVPQRFWRGHPEEEAFWWASADAEIRWMRGHCFDPFIWMSAPMEIDHTHNVAPHIEQRHRIERDPDHPYPILCSEWESEEGKLSARIRVTEDYPFDRMEMFSDYNTSRYIEPLLATGEDMLTLVRMDPFRLPASGELSGWWGRCRAQKAIADREQLPMACHGGASLDYLIHGCTADGAVMLALDFPDETTALLDYLNERTDQAAAMCLEAGADFTIRRGWYDSADFWGPREFALFAAPFIRRHTQLVHDAGALSAYLMCTGVVPMLGELAKLDFDCLTGTEPVCTGQDLGLIRSSLAADRSFWTGLSAPIHIGMGTPDQVRQAVRDAFDLFGNSGFLLAATPTIRKHWPWANVEAMMDEYWSIQRGRLPARGSRP